MPKLPGTITPVDLSVSMPDSMFHFLSFIEDGSGGLGSGKAYLCYFPICCTFSDGCP